jgi:hypothetical protein
VTALDRDEPQRAQHLGVDDRDRLGRVESPKRALGRARSSSSPPASASGSRPSRRFASVTVGRVPPAP